MSSIGCVCRCSGGQGTHRSDAVPCSQCQSLTVFFSLPFHIMRAHQLLDEPDWDIFYWMTDRKPVADRWKESFKTEGRLGWRLRKHARNEDREQRFMPDL